MKEGSEKEKGSEKERGSDKEKGSEKERSSEMKTLEKDRILKEEICKDFFHKSYFKRTFENEFNIKQIFFNPLIQPLFTLELEAFMEPWTEVSDLVESEAELEVESEASEEGLGVSEVLEVSEEG